MSDTERSLIYSIDNDLVETQIFGQGASVNCFIFSSKSLPYLSIDWACCGFQYSYVFSHVSECIVYTAAKLA